MKLEAGLARCLYKPANTKDHRQPTEAGRGSTTIVPWSPGREPCPADTWALDFWPPGLWESKFLGFTIWSFWVCFDRMACEILVLGSGREPTPPELEARSLNPGTAGEVPKFWLFKATRRPARPPCPFPSHPTAAASHSALWTPPHAPIPLDVAGGPAQSFASLLYCVSGPVTCLPEPPFLNV